MKKRYVLNCIATLLMIGVFVHYMGYLMRPVDTDTAISSINAFHSLPEDTVEVIGFGSSHMWRGLDPRVMYTEYGIGAYNYGCNWQTCNTTSLFIQDALRTQSPKVALIDACFLGLLRLNTDMNGEIYYTKAIPETPAKWRYLKQCFGNDWERYLSYYVPLVAFHDNWSRMSEGMFRKISEGQEFYSTCGFVDSSAVTEVTISEQKTQEKLSDEALAEIDYIVKTCKENGVEIVFYLTPYEGTFLYSEEMKRLAASYGYPYLDLFELYEEVGLDENTDFSDEAHLNTAGAQKVARYLARYLKDHYDLTDMRMTDDNFWERYVDISN